MSMPYEKGREPDLLLKVAGYALILGLIGMFALGVVLVSKGAFEAVSLIIVSVAIGIFGDIRRLTGI